MASPNPSRLPLSASPAASLPPNPSRLPFFASPAAFLMTLTFMNWFGFASWQALFNNFAKDSAQFTGWEIGVLQSVREIPGFLSFTAAFLFLLMREQTLAYASILLLGVGVAVTGYFPSYYGLLLTTCVMSAGVHYFEPANQALSLQLLPKKEAPKVLGQIASASAAAQLIAYSLIALVWWGFQPSYQTVYLAFGLGTLLLAGAAIVLFRRFDGDVPQRKGIVLRRRYWLYYALAFLSGARRQLFMAFGGWLLVERFGYDLGSLSGLLFAYCAINIVAGPLFGRLIGRIGERATIILENVSLIGVFLGYAFTINHIAAVVIPVFFGRLWIQDPSLVFKVGAGIATASLALAFLVPRHPEPGQETVFGTWARPIPAE